MAYGMPNEWVEDGSINIVPRRWNLGIELGEIEDVMEAAGDGPANRGVLKAFDPLTGETHWEVVQSHHWNGGVLATRGALVFQGNSEGEVNAFDADTGERLWSFNAYTAFLAPPISYQLDGRQYVAILAGTGGGDLFGGEVEALASVNYGNKGKLLVFALDGTATLPVPELRNREIPELQAVDLRPEDIASGKRLYYQVCSMCHGAAAKSAGTLPDLRMMSEQTRGQFREIVLGGLRADKGMASFADTLTPEDADQILAYLTSRAIEDRAESRTVRVGDQE